MHPTLSVEILYGFPHIATGELLNGFFERWVFLAHDLIKVRCLHSGLLQLLVRSTSLHCFMLPRIADKQYPVMIVQSVQELVHLFRARQAGFVEDIEPLLPVVGPVFAVEMPLQRA
jgi:hypothetical protein